MITEAQLSIQDKEVWQHMLHIYQPCSRSSYRTTNMVELHAHAVPQLLSASVDLANNLRDIVQPMSMPRLSLRYKAIGLLKVSLVAHCLVI